MNDLEFFCPSNLVVPYELRGQDVKVDGDVYNMCERVKQIDERLRVLPMLNDEKYPFAISMICEDGVERLVFRMQELDARSERRLQYLASIPLTQRLDEFEAETAKREADRKEEELERMYEEMGQQMWKSLEDCGFIQRPVSYPKAGVATGGKKAR